RLTIIRALTHVSGSSVTRFRSTIRPNEGSNRVWAASAVCAAKISGAVTTPDISIEQTRRSGSTSNDHALARFTIEPLTTDCAATGPAAGRSTESTTRNLRVTSLRSGTSRDVAQT